MSRIPYNCPRLAAFGKIPRAEDGFRRRGCGTTKRDSALFGEMPMSRDNGSVPVTRREFYSALALIWLYIALVLGDLTRIETRWTTVILFLAAIVSAFSYVVYLLRSRRPDATNIGAGASPSGSGSRLGSDAHEQNPGGSDKP